MSEYYYDRDLFDETSIDSGSVDFCVYDTERHTMYMSWAGGGVYAYTGLVESWERLVKDTKDLGSVGKAIGLIPSGDFVRDYTVPSNATIVLKEVPEEVADVYEVHIEFTGTVKVRVEGANSFAEAESKASELFDKEVMDGSWTPVLVRKVK